LRQRFGGLRGAVGGGHLCLERADVTDLLPSRAERLLEPGCLLGALARGLEGGFAEFGRSFGLAAPLGDVDELEQDLPAPNRSIRDEKERLEGALGPIDVVGIERLTSERQQDPGVRGVDARRAIELLQRARRVAGSLARARERQVDLRATFGLAR